LPFSFTSILSLAAEFSKMTVPNFAKCSEQKKGSHSVPEKNPRTYVDEIGPLQ